MNIIHLDDKIFAMARRFTFSMECSGADSWRHNIDLMYVCYDSSGNKLSHGSIEDHIAPVGTNLKTPPEGFAIACRKVEIVSDVCDSVRLLGYVNTHSMPTTKSVSQMPPFALRVKVFADGELLYDKVRNVSVWGGDSIDLKF